MKAVGGCLCGQVRYRAEGEPLNARVCHCRMCQKVTGGALYGRILFRRGDVEISGPIREYRSSDDLARGFCTHCGATVYSSRDTLDAIGLTAGTLDDPAVFEPSMHIWTSSRQPWVHLDDGLPQYAEGPPPA